ncbi:MAG TPA: GNAT family N-acetyltransferase, partial [Acidimicrobiales bacterium]
EDIALGHENLVSYSRAMSGWSLKGTHREEPGSLLCAGGSWLPAVGNVALRTDSTLPGTALLDRAFAFFSERQRGFNVMVRDTSEDDDLAAACESHGIKPFGDPTPQMICPARLADPVVPDGVKLVEVHDVQGVRDAVAVNAEAYATYGMPLDVLPDVFDHPEAVVANPDTVIVVAYLGDRPVATALTYMSHGVGALQWVGTASDVRSLHLGRAVTTWATNAAFDRGAASCSLQASPMGEPLYAKLGYETAYRYRELICWQPPESGPSVAAPVTPG